MHIKIEHAGKQHAALLAQMGEKTFYDTYALQNTKEDMELYLRSRFTTAAVSAEFDEPGVRFYIAYHNGQPIGYTKLGAHTPPQLQGKKCMELERLYLLKSFHGNGIGRQMLQHCIDTATSAGCEILWLGVWEHNPKAIRLYIQAGFVKFGQHIFQLGNDAQTDTLMKQELGKT